MSDRFKYSQLIRAHELARSALSTLVQARVRLEEAGFTGGLIRESQKALEGVQEWKILIGKELGVYLDKDLPK